MSEHERAESFISSVEKLVEQNYPSLEIARDRSSYGTSVSESSNSVIARVFIQPNKYHHHIESDVIRRRVEEIASIATERRATSLTSMRESRQDLNLNFHFSYPDSIRIMEISGTDNRGYPIFELDFKYLDRDR